MNKVCSKCKQEKPIGEFNKRKERKQGNGLSSKCKSCLSKISKIWRNKNRERLIAKLKQYHITHQEEARKYRRANRKRDSEYEKQYYKINKEKRLEYQRQYRVKNKQKIHAQALIQYQVSRGYIIPPTLCQKCKQKLVQCSHHPDYSKPLKVYWICDECHMRIHANLKKGK